MAARRKKRSSGNSSALGWFVAGLVIGAIGAVVLYQKGFMPELPQDEEAEQTTAADSSILDPEEVAGNGSPQYDFFTVLPEMEVVVPERELDVEPNEPAVADASSAGPADGGQYILQVGSFRNAADADQMKARLALLGSSASIQAVTVNNETWHRVRIGPVSGIGQANQLRRQLQDNGIDVLVLKGNG